MTKKMVFALVMTSTFLVIAAAITINLVFDVNMFGERKFATLYSALQLVAIAGIVVQVNWNSPLKSPAIIWKIIALGFLFLAVDELFLIHENIDFLIHRILNMEETGLTDRIDDLIVGLYGLVGLGVLYAFRSEFTPHREAIPYLVIGFVLLFLMVVFDTLTNRNDILPLIFDPQLATTLANVIRPLEDSSKIFAESFFLLGFYAILQKAQSIERGTVPAAKPA